MELTLKLQLIITLEAGAKMLKLEANFSCILASYIFFTILIVFCIFFLHSLQAPLGLPSSKKNQNIKNRQITEAKIQVRQQFNRYCLIVDRYPKEINIDSIVPFWITLAKTIIRSWNNCNKTADSFPCYFFSSDNTPTT